VNVLRGARGNLGEGAVRHCHAVPLIRPEGLRPQPVKSQGGGEQQDEIFGCGKWFFCGQK